MAQDNPNFERLKQKYQPALNAIGQQQVRLENLHMQGDQLFIRGEAPSQEAKNRVWDQIKLVDATYSDLIADIRVSETATATATQTETVAPKVQTAGAAIGGGQASRKYTVVSGDTLSKMSRHFYGDGGKFMKIFEANRDRLSDPNKIQVGQELEIPE